MLRVLCEYGMSVRGSREWRSVAAYCRVNRLGLGQYAFVRTNRHLDDYRDYFTQCGGVCWRGFRWLFANDYRFRTHFASSCRHAFHQYACELQLPVVTCPRYLHVYWEIQQHFPDFTFEVVRNYGRRLEVRFAHFPGQQNGCRPSLLDVINGKVHRFEERGNGCSNRTSLA